MTQTQATTVTLIGLFFMAVGIVWMMRVTRRNTRDIELLYGFEMQNSIRLTELAAEFAELKDLVKAHNEMLNDASKMHNALNDSVNVMSEVIDSHTDDIARFNRMTKM